MCWPSSVSAGNNLNYVPNSGNAYFFGTVNFHFFLMKKRNKKNQSATADKIKELAAVIKK